LTGAGLNLASVKVEKKYYLKEICSPGGYDLNLGRIKLDKPITADPCSESLGSKDMFPKKI
jgi:hypothetical protein